MSLNKKTFTKNHYIDFYSFVSFILKKGKLIFKSESFEYISFSLEISKCFI